MGRETAFGRRRVAMETWQDEQRGYVVALARGHRSVGARTSISIWRTSDGGQTWTPLPMRLGLGSWLRFAWRTHWPPENVDSLEVRESTIQITFHDEWIPWDRTDGHLGEPGCHQGGMSGR